MGLFTAFSMKRKWMARFKRLGAHLHRVSGDNIISLTDALALKTFLFVGTIVDTKEMKDFAFLQGSPNMEKESIVFLSYMVENYIERYWDEDESEVQKNMILGNYRKKLCYLLEKEYGMESYFADQIIEDRMELYKGIFPNFPVSDTGLRVAAKKFYCVTEFTKKKNAICLLDITFDDAKDRTTQVDNTLDFFVKYFEPSLEEEISSIKNFDIIGVGLRESSDMTKYMFL